MYTTSYKLNNSYTTYVIRDNGKDDKHYEYRKPVKLLEWKSGTKVKHNYFGEGKIKKITDNQIFVGFSNAGASKRWRNIQVIFEFKKAPSEIGSLKLCY